MLCRESCFEVFDEILETYPEFSANHAKLNNINSPLPALDFTDTRLPKRKSVAQLRLR